jgi:hypothetical protein
MIRVVGSFAPKGFVMLSLQPAAMARSRSASSPDIVTMMIGIVDKQDFLARGHRLPYINERLSSSLLQKRRTNHTAGDSFTALFCELADTSNWRTLRQPSVRSQPALQPQLQMRSHV